MITLNLSGASMDVSQHTRQKELKKKRGNGMLGAKVVHFELMKKRGEVRGESGIP